MVIAVQYSPQAPVALAGNDIAAGPAMHAYGRRRLEVPLARVVLLQRLVREYARGTDLDQVAAELALEHAVLVAAEVNMVVAGEDIEVPAAGVAPVEPDAAVALDAAVHLVVDEGAEMLVAVRSFFEPRSSIIVPGHDRHVLEVAFASLIADRAVMRMVQHEPFDDARPEGPRLGIIHGEAHAVGHGSHAGHDDPAARVLLVPKQLHRALPARAHGMHGRVPAEVGEVEPQGQAGVK